MRALWNLIVCFVRTVLRAIVWILYYMWIRPNRYRR